MSFDDSSFFDLTTPDPEFLGFTDRPEDQLPGRPTEGKIAIDRFFDSLKLFVTETQQRGTKIYDHLKANNLPVLGPNVGEHLYQNQHLIPADLRGNAILVFWGKIYRNFCDHRYVACLVWVGGRWEWRCGWFDSGGGLARGRAVLLAS